MGGSSAYIDHADAVGSTTMETGPAGAVLWDVVNGPWGQAWQQTGTRQSEVFAGMDWQVNDPLMPSATREYSDGLGRWMTPDPGGVKVVSLANPQTWNMYAYVTDNPTTLNDPSGLAACSYTNLSACFEVLNNPHASASEENSAHNSAKGVNSEQETTVTYETSTTTHDSSGDVTVTTTTVTANFNKKTGNFMSATTDTTSYVVSADALGRNVVSNRADPGPHTLTQPQFTNFLNGRGVAIDPGPAVWYATVQAHDIATHPGRYAMDAAALAAAPALGLGEAAEGIITAIHALHSAYELQKEVGVGGAQ